MDRGIVEQKLEALRHCVERAAQRCPESAASLESDPDAQDILVLNLSRSVQLSVDIASHIVAGTSAPAPATMGQAFESLFQLGIIDRETAMRMRKAVGFQNIAVGPQLSIN